jgi:uncharacterized protein
MNSPPPPRSRIDLLDAMRGSALLGILLLHALHHWGLMRYPLDAPGWLKALDAQTLRFGLSFLEGKAYAVFAMMFGVSFFLLLDRWSERRVNFRARFLWRLAVLAGLGYLHGIIYSGDILLTIAILGVPLVYLSRLGNRTLGWIAATLLLQVPLLWATTRLLFDPGFQPWQPQPWVAYRDLFELYAQGSFRDVTVINAWEGQVSRLWWAIESGRHAQMSGLFICGLLIGRSRIFEDPARCVRLARRALLWGLAGVVILHALKLQLADASMAGTARNFAGSLLSSYRALAQAAVWMGAFVLLYQWTRARKVLSLLAPCGRMSLTCYVTQGLIGVPLFYGYGLGLYRHLGPLHSMLLGGALFVVQCACANLWLKHFNFGPLEWVWRCCTFLDFSTPMRKREPMEAAAAPAPALLERRGEG